MAFFCTQTCVSFAEGPITYTPPSCLMVGTKSSELEIQPCHVLAMLPWAKYSSLSFRGPSTLINSTEPLGRLRKVLSVPGT